METTEGKVHAKQGSIALKRFKLFLRKSHLKKLTALKATQISSPPKKDKVKVHVNEYYPTQELRCLSETPPQ